ncbi:MAG: hypothetical protein H6711_15250 [Myxococcales bacterium]|nr:hypothetical protein [Myxococcales bacterium]
MTALLVTTAEALGGLVFGLALALASIASTRHQCRRGDRAPAAALRFELVAWALYLVLAAAIYVGFALREGGHGWMPLELGGLVGYTALAWLGVRRPRLLALAWLLHAGWDMVIHGDAPAALVPGWYRWACLAFDVVAAAYLVRLARPRR